MWGYPLRGRKGIYAVVAQLAHEILPRNGGRPQPRGADRVEQIHEAWRSSERTRRHWKQQSRAGTYEWALPERWRFTKAALDRRRPRRGWGLRRYARALLANGGTWRWSSRRLQIGLSPRAQELTPMAEKALEQMPRIVRRKTG